MKIWMPYLSAAMILLAIAIHCAFSKYETLPFRSCAYAKDMACLPANEILYLGSTVLLPRPGSAEDMLGGRIAAQKGIFARDRVPISAAAVMAVGVPIVLLAFAFHLLFAFLRAGSLCTPKGLRLWGGRVVQMVFFGLFYVGAALAMIDAVWTLKITGNLFAR